MSKKIPIILLCSVAIFVAALFTVTQLLAGGKSPPFGKYPAITTFNQLEVVAPKIKERLKKRYHRNDEGCVSSVEFFNDPANCAGNDKCLDMLKQKPPQAKWRLAIRMEKTDRPKKDPIIPIIWDEILVGVGSTKGESDVCGDWRFTVAGSPGWDCDYVVALDRIVCSCIGFYVGNPDYPQYDPPGYCCDPTGCVPTPL